MLGLVPAFSIDAELIECAPGWPDDRKWNCCLIH